MDPSRKSGWGQILNLRISVAEMRYFKT